MYENASLSEFWVYSPLSTLEAVSFNAVNILFVDFVMNSSLCVMSACPHGCESCGEKNNEFTCTGGCKDGFVSDGKDCIRE